MTLFLEQALFTLGSFEVTPTILVLTIVAVLLLVALVCYRFNHRKQTKVAQFMDNECHIYNKKGIAKFISKKGKKFSNPTIVVVEIRNLSYLYISCQKRNKMMYDVANQMVSGLKKKETAGRIEFDKFVLILDGKSPEEIKELCAKLDRRLDTMNIDGFGMYDFYIYFGIYENAPLAEPEIMYTAASIIQFTKVIEENRYYYSTEVQVAIDKIKKMNAEKDEDFANGKFVPYVQPKVDLLQKKVIGGEILARWTDGNNGFKFSPSEFIPFFEYTGFIKKLDEAMLKAACELAQTMVQKGESEILISVNVSKIDLMSTSYDTFVMDIVRQYQISPKNIELEITDTSTMDNFKYISNCINNLRQMGFTVSMDDYGTGTSTLSSLKSHPFDTVKLDKFFFDNHLRNESDRAVVRNHLEMFSKLNYTKVCEGVEDRATLDALAAICHDIIVQGYCICPPIPLPQFAVFALQPFEYDLPPLAGQIEAPAEPQVIEVETKEIEKDYIDATVQNLPNGGTSINISGLGSNQVPVVDNSTEINDLRRQLEDMRVFYERTLDEQRQKAHDDEMRRLREEMDQLRNRKEEPKNNENEYLRAEIERIKIQQMLQQQNNANSNNNQRDYRDDEISRLRREIDDLRYTRETRERYVVQDRYVNVGVGRDRDYDSLQRQIDDLRIVKKDKGDDIPVVQQNINIEELIERLSKTQNEQARLAAERTAAQFKDLKDMLEQERKEREELEAMLYDLQNRKEEEEIDEATLEKEQEEADKNLNLDLSTLSTNDVIEDEDDEDEEEEEKLEKPTLSLEELEAIIQSYRDKYSDDWNQHAKDELQDGYFEVINGLKYYEKYQKRTFLDKIRSANPEVKQLFNIVKNEIMKYQGVTNKLTNSYDCFYLGRNQIAKLSLTNRKVKVYLAADPAKYPERQFPHKDMSVKKSHVRTPYYTMIKSQLSVKRINKVIADVMSERNISVNEGYKPVDYATKYKHLKTN